MKKIIIIDDDKQIVKMLGFFLRKNNFDVTEAYDGREAVKLLQNNDYDLAICDIIMPEAEGIETITYMHNKFPRLKIMAISGYTKNNYLGLAMTFGAHEAISKPIDMQHLLLTVEQMLRY